MASVITLWLGRSPTMGNGTSLLIADGFWGVSMQASTGGGGEGLEVAEATGDVCIFQAEMRTPKFCAEGFGLGLKHGYLLFDGEEEVGIGAVIPLNVCVDTPIVGSEDLLNDEGVGVGTSLNVSEEPGRKGVRDVVGVDVWTGVEILNEDGVIRSSSSTHDTSLVNVFDVASLHGEAVNDDGEVGDAASILFETLRTLDSVSLFIGMDVMLQLFNSGSGASPDSLDADPVVSLLFGKGCHRQGTQDSKCP